MYRGARARTIPVLAAEEQRKRGCTKDKCQGWAKLLFDSLVEQTISL